MQPSPAPVDDVEADGAGVPDVVVVGPGDADALTLAATVEATELIAVDWLAELTPEGRDRLVQADTASAATATVAASLTTVRYCLRIGTVDTA